MSKKSETRIIVNYEIIGEVMNPILVIRPDNTEEWCQKVELHGSSTVQYDKHIVYTTTEEHVVTHIALEKHEKVKYEPGMVSCGGVEWATSADDIDFSK
jgi:hypothetical protein|tara:strand:+ start:1057 stop:1353 length:297 start_codon:yes stop_codon:yes gene_type:complete